MRELISDLLICIYNPPIIDYLPHKHMFTICLDDHWYGDILVYMFTKKLQHHLSCDDQCHIHHKSPYYLLIGDVLYRQGVHTILCCCLTLNEVKKVLNECHGDSCGGHLFGMAISEKKHWD